MGMWQLNTNIRKSLLDNIDLKCLCLNIGKWLLVPDYIDKCSRHGRWLPEAEFEWSMKWKHYVDVPTRSILAAPSKWRKKVPTSRPFLGWRVAVLVENATRRRVYST